MKYFYAVARGREPGIYETWAECLENIDGYSNARYKKFDNEDEAKAFIERYKNLDKGITTQTVSTNRKRPASADEDASSSAKKNKSTAGSATNATAEQWIADGVPVVYTDGSCFSNGKQGRKAGYGVFWGDDSPDNISEPLSVGPATNNRAELTAVIEALRQADKKGYKRLVVRTDSNLLIQSMTVWIESWRKNGWKTSAGTDVKNKDLLVELDSVLKKVQVCFDHIRGHVGIHGNEKADELARAGAKRYKEQ